MSASSEIAVPHEPKVTRLTGEGGGGEAAARNFERPVFARSPKQAASGISILPEGLREAAASSDICVRPDLHEVAPRLGLKQ